jgi:hypothetical protein
MPDTRTHRGPHPEDAELFAPRQWPALRAAVGELSWLLTRGYATPSSLKLVGDRHRLTERQRVAVMRCSCADAALAGRLAREVPAEQLAGEPLELDGYNILTTLEAALGGGVLLRGRDGCVRDMASMHGHYKRVAETPAALEMLGEAMAGAGVPRAEVLLDAPVSNSGRLRAAMLELAAARGWTWDVRLVADPDPVLAASTGIVVSADSAILDGMGTGDAGPRWVNLAARVIAERLPEVTVVPMAHG